MKKKKKDTALKWIYRCSKRYLWAVMLMAMITGVISGSFILLALISSRLLDIASGSMEGSLGVEISIIACLIFLQAVLNIVYRNLQIRTATKIEMSIRQGIFSMLQRKQYRDVCGMHSGEILNRLTSDIDLVVVGVVGLIPQAISLSTKILAGLGVLLSIDATFTFLVLGVGVMVFVCSRLYSRRFKHLHKEVQRTNGIVRSFLQECLENLAVIKSFANGDLVCDKLGQYQRENYRIRVKRTAISNFANTAVYVMFTAGYSDKENLFCWILCGLSLGSSPDFGGRIDFWEADRVFTDYPANQSPFSQCIRAGASVLQYAGFRGASDGVGAVGR